MKSKKNLTRFTYKSAAFQGWRLCLSRHGVTFVKYFSDRRFGGERKSLVAAEAALAAVKQMLDGVIKGDDGKLPTTMAIQVDQVLSKAISNEAAGMTAPAPVISRRKNADRVSGRIGSSAVDRRLRTPA